jgi:hypothetical protein
MRAESQPSSELKCEACSEVETYAIHVPKDIQSLEIYHL